jgi:hypothetical protein
MFAPPYMKSTGIKQYLQTTEKDNIDKPKEITTNLKKDDEKKELHSTACQNNTPFSR